MSAGESASDSVVVFDFETTGLSARQGDRAIEIGAVKVRDGRIVERFQQLMNPGVWIPPFITSLTGIDNAMVSAAPPCDKVMAEFAEFTGQLPMVAHNAAFDRRFLEAEWAYIGRPLCNQLACTMLLARRLYQDAPEHKLGSLVSYLALPDEARHHRALADAEMCAHLYLRICDDLCARHRQAQIPFALLQGYGKQNKQKANDWLSARLSKRSCA